MTSYDCGTSENDYKIRLENNCVIKICKKNKNNNTSNLLSYSLSQGQTIDKSKLTDSQYKILEALASGNECDTDDDIDILTWRDLVRTTSRFGTPTDVFRELGIKNFSFKSGVVTIETKSGDIINITMFPKFKKADTSKTSKSKKISPFIKDGKKLEQPKLNLKNWQNESTKSYSEWHNKLMYQKYLNGVGQHEASKKGYGEENSIGFLGRYQMGEKALIDAGFYIADGTCENDWIGTWTKKAKEFGVTSKSSFLNNKKAQDYAINVYHKKQWGYIKHFGLDKALYSKINGITITPSGLLAAAHLVGAGEVIKYFKSNGRYVPKDQFGTSVEKYLKELANYDVSHITGTI